MTQNLNRIFDKKDMYSKTISYYLDYDNSLSFEKIFGLPSNLFYKNFDKKKFLYELLGLYYRNEYFVKRFFIINNLLNNSDYFCDEVIVGDSRCDLLSFKNDKSTCYEIKTKYDNLNRLNKQINDYLKNYNYVYVVCHINKLDSLSLPDCVGIYCYDDNSNRIRKIKKAALNDNVDKISQLLSFTKKDLASYFNGTDVIKISNAYTKKHINKVFVDMCVNKNLESFNSLKEECLELVE